MNNPPKREGILFILSAPSGAGKTTLRTMLQRTPDFVYSISCTTRQPRPGEVHGQDYFFLQKEEFESRVQKGDFLEHAAVFANHYGTLRETVLESLDRGVDVLLDIDIQGAAMIRATTHEKIRAAISDVFLMPANMDVLRQRLLKRGTENADQLAIRLGKAETEMKERDKYRYNIISGTPEEDFENFRAIMLAERQVSRRLRLD